MTADVHSKWDEARRILVVQAASDHSATLIFLQGIGTIPATFGPGGGWKEVVEYWAACLPWLKIVVPSAPQPRASWFDSKEGIEVARASLCGLIDEEAKANGTKRVFLSGFSQGGMLGLYAGLMRCAQSSGPGDCLGGKPDNIVTVETMCAVS